MKIGKPYRIDGVWYYPMPSAAGYSERGTASWYGPNFHGKPTANGERYDMYAMTAAHTRLPMPTRVRVTNLSNGRQVVVRVNDRGPFVKNRLIDMSYAAAKQLDMVGKGTAPVLVEALATGSSVLEPKKAPVTPPPPEVQAVKKKKPDGKAGLYVQMGAFTESHRAQAMKAELAGQGRVMIQEATVGGKRYFRVRVGPSPTVDKAIEAMNALEQAGFGKGRIVMD